MKKVSLYINETLWIKFKEAVLRKHGTLRKLSNEVESLLRFFLVEQEVQTAFEKLGIKMSSAISSEKIKESRPRLRGLPSEDLIREMRRRRVAEALSRQ
mgnify:CR=1 FL=1